jgi:hypothetical protein
MPDPIESRRWLDPAERAALHTRIDRRHRQATRDTLGRWTLLVGPPLLVVLLSAAAIVAARS